MTFGELVEGLGAKLGVEMTDNELMDLVRLNASAV